MANQLDTVLKKTQAVYKQAAEELKKKLADFQAKFAAKDKEKRAILAAGEITQQEYKSWLAGQVFQGKQWEAKAKEAAETLVHANQEAAAIVNDGCMTAYAAAMNYGTYELEKATALKTGFTLYNRETVSRLLAKDPQLLPYWKIDQPKDYLWNYEKVKNAIIQGIIQGKPIPEITGDLTDKLQTLNTNRMRLFARTGMTGAHNAGRMDALHRAADKGIKVQKKWLTMIDGRQRDAHEDLDGQIREIDEPFDSELGEIMYPGDPSADPANVYNCRCTLVYIYPELEEAPEGTEEAPEYEQMTFDQWVEAKENQEAVQGETDPETVTAEDAREPEPEIMDAAEELEQTEPEPELPEEEKKDPEDYTVDEIMEKVNAMEQAGEWDDEKKNLLPMADEETRTGAHELYMSIPENEREALEEKTTVKIADLYTEQAEVFTPRLEDLAESFDGEKISGAATEDHPTGITVAKYDDQLIVLDGNNRTNLAILKGQEELDVMLVDLDAMKQTDAIPEPAVVQGTDISETFQRRPEKFATEIEDVINAQGFDGNPRIVSQEEFDQAVKESGFVAQRTYSAPDQETLDAYRDQLYYGGQGNWYVDCSNGGAHFGQGMYCTGANGTEITQEITDTMKYYSTANETVLTNLEKETTEEIIERNREYIEKNYSITQEHAETVEKLVYGRLDGTLTKQDDFQLYKTLTGEEKRQIASLTEDMRTRAQPEIIKRNNPVSAIETMTMTPGARTITWEGLEKMYTDEGYKRGRDMDIGAYAAKKGYDAIVQVPNTLEGNKNIDIVILNRTKTIILGGK